MVVMVIKDSRRIVVVVVMVVIEAHSDERGDFIGDILKDRLETMRGDGCNEGWQPTVLVQGVVVGCMQWYRGGGDGGGGEDGGGGIYSVKW